MTLTVVLCAHNEERHLREQLDAILGQSRPVDELVLLDDGSTDGTAEILERRGVRYSEPRGSALRDHDPAHSDPRGSEYLTPRRGVLVCNPAPSGPNRAYNQAVRYATSDWVYLAGAHDVLQPGALEAFARQASAHPEAVLIAGDLVDVACGWLPCAGFLTPADLCRRWQPADMHWINGNATFIKRTAWQGELPELAWLGDWWQYHTLALRRGLIYLPFPITQWRPLANSHSHGYQDAGRMASVARELARLLDDPENADIREAFLGTRLLDIPHAGSGVVRGMLAHPRGSEYLTPGLGLEDVDPVPDACFPDGNWR